MFELYIEMVSLNFRILLTFWGMYVRDIGNIRMINFNFNYNDKFKSQFRFKLDNCAYSFFVSTLTWLNSLTYKLFDLHIKIFSNSCKKEDSYLIVFYLILILTILKGADIAAAINVRLSYFLPLTPRKLYIIKKKIPSCEFIPTIMLN